MTGYEHFLEAERLRERAQEAQNHAYDNDTERSWNNASYYNAAAQVHATLALAATQLAMPLSNHHLSQKDS